MISHPRGAHRRKLGGISALLLASVLAGCLKEAPPADTPSPQQLPAVGTPMDLSAEPVGGEAGMGRLLTLCTRLHQAHDLRNLTLCLERFSANLGVGGYRNGEQQVSRDEAMGRVHTLQARTALELGKHARALELAHQAVTELQGTPMGRGSPLAEALLLEALAQALGGQRFEAEKLLTTLQEGKGSSKLPLVNEEPPYLEMGVIHLALGDPFKARDLLEKALNASKGKPDGLTLPDDLAAWAALGLEADPVERTMGLVRLPVAILLTHLLLETGALDEAAARLQALLTHPQLQGRPSVRALLLHDRGRIARKQGDAKLAVRLFREAATLLESRRHAIDPLVSTVGLTTDQERIHTDLVALLVAEGNAVEAFAWAEQGKRHALSRLLSDRLLFPGGPQLQETLPSATLEELRDAELAAAVQDPQRTPEQQAALEARIQTLRQRILEARPPWAMFTLTSETETDRILAQLPPEELMLLFYGTGEDLFAFVAGRTQIWATPLDGKGLEASVEALRRGLAKPQGEEYKKVAYDLYRRLIDPLEARLKEATGLTIVPHGALNRLPFAALHDGKAFFGDRYALRTLPTASTVTSLNNRQAGRNQGLLALVDPLSPINRESFPHAQNEQQAISRFRNPVRMLARHEATETLFKNYARDFGAIHLIGLAHFQGGDPARSGLLLAKDGANDGLVSVDELFTLHLGAEMVTLHASRFEGGGNNDLGLTALSQGILYAGSDALLLPLWRSDGWATAALMEQLYRNLKLQQDRRTALRNAQKALRNNGYDHPHYWSGFLLTGGMDNLLPDVPAPAGSRRVVSAPPPFQPQPMPPGEKAPALPRAQVVAQAEELPAPRTGPEKAPAPTDGQATPKPAETPAKGTAPTPAAPPTEEAKPPAPAAPAPAAAAPPPPADEKKSGGAWQWLTGWFSAAPAEASPPVPPPIDLAPAVAAAQQKGAPARPESDATPATTGNGATPAAPPPTPESRKTEAGINKAGDNKADAPELSAKAGTNKAGDNKADAPELSARAPAAPPAAPPAPKEASGAATKASAPTTAGDAPATSPPKEEKKAPPPEHAPAAPTLLAASPGGSLAKAPLPKSGLSSSTRQAGMGSIHYIHMGSYTSDDSLGKAAEWIRARGLTVEVQEVMIKRQWYKRLLVGPFREVAAVEKAVAALQENGEGVVPEVVPPLRPAKPAEPPKPAEPIKTDEPTKSAKPTIKAVEPAKPAAPIKAVEPSKPDAPIKADEPAKPDAPIKTDEPTKPAESTKTDEPAKPAEPPKAELPTPVKPNKAEKPTPVDPAQIEKTILTSDEEQGAAPAQKIPPSEAYYVQMGAYANKGGATRPIQFIESRGMPWKLEAVQGQTRVLYKLLVGPYGDAISALSVLQILEEIEDGATPFLVSPPEAPPAPKAAPPAGKKKGASR